MLMDSSALIDIEKSSRTRWYFNRFRYCMSAHLPEAFVLRHRDHGWIDSIVARRMDWGRRLVSQPGSWQWQRLELSLTDIDNLHRVLCWIQENDTAIKVTVCGDHFYVYTNDVDLMQQAALLPGTTSIKATEITLKGQAGAVNVRASDYQQRTYLRCRKITAEQKQRLKDLLSHQSDVRIGPGLAQWLQDANLHVREYHFIDHNMPSLLTLLELSISGLVRKTMPIVTDK